MRTITLKPCTWLVVWLFFVTQVVACNTSLAPSFGPSTTGNVVVTDIPQRSVILPLNVQVAYNSDDDIIFWKLSWAGSEGKFHDYFRHDGTNWNREGRGFRGVGSELFEQLADSDHTDCARCHYVEVDAECSNCHSGPGGEPLQRDAAFESLGTGAVSAEDRAFIAFTNPQGETLSGDSTWVPEFNQYGCFLSCHGDNVDMPVWNASGEVFNHDQFMQLPDGPAYDEGVIDLWHWRAHRSAPVGYADDQFIRQFGRGGDNGKRTWTPQYLDADGNPGLTFDPASTVDGIFAFDFDNLATTEDYFFTDGLTGLPQSLAFAAATGLGYTPEQGDTVPVRNLIMPTGSRGDVTTDGSFYDSALGRWNVFFQRDLVPATGDTDDMTTDDVRDVAFTDLAILYWVALGVHADNSASRDHYVSFPLSLGFGNPAADLNVVEIATGGVEPDFSDTATFPVTVVDLFLPGVTSWDYLIGQELGAPVGGPMHGGFLEVSQGISECKSCHTVREDDPRTATTSGGSMELTVLRRGGVMDHTPISFVNHIKPILDSRCGTSGCHGSTSLASSALFADGVSTDDSYFNLLAIPNGIDPNDPVNSYLLLKALDSPDLLVAHGGGAIFSSMQDPDFAKMLRWILINTPNN